MGRASRGKTERATPAAKPARKRAPARTRPPARKPAVEVEVDVLGQRRVEMVANMIAGFQEQRFELELVKTANEHKDSDKIPGYPPDEEGWVPTYRQRRADLLEMEHNIEAGYPELMDRVRELVDQRDGVQRVTPPRLPRSRAGS